jgi:hypothetical protein
MVFQILKAAIECGHASAGSHLGGTMPVAKKRYLRVIINPQNFHYLGMRFLTRKETLHQPETAGLEKGPFLILDFGPMAPAETRTVGVQVINSLGGSKFKAKELSTIMKGRTVKTRVPDSNVAVAWSTFMGL